MQAVALLLILTTTDEAGAQSNDRPRITVQVKQADLSFDELRRLIPALEAIALPPDVSVEHLRASGPLTALDIDAALASVNSRIDAKVTANVTAPERTITGTVTFDNANLARLLRRPTLPTGLTGSSTLDLRVSTGSETSLRGTFSIDAQRISVAGYEAEGTQARGRLDGQTIALERSSVRAYGARITAEGRLGLPFGGRPFTADLSGRAHGVDLSRLPASLPAPSVDTNLDLTFALANAGQGWSGRVRLNESRVASGTLSAGTVASFDATGERVTYHATGRASGIDPRRIGKALRIETLAADRFAGTVNGEFSLDGIGSTLQPISFTLSDTKLFGGTLRKVVGTAGVLEDRITFSASGFFEDVDTATVLQQPQRQGSVTGELQIDGALARSAGEFDWGDLVLLDGAVELTSGTIEGIAIDRLALQGRVAGLVASIRTFEFGGPDLEMSASGVLSFDGATPSMLTYHINAPRLMAFADVLGEVRGDATLEGQVTGRDVLRFEGTVASTGIASHGIEAQAVNAKYEVELPPAAPSSATGDAQIDAAVLRIAGRALSEAEFDLGYRDRRVTFDAEVREEPRTIAATGNVLLQPGRQHVVLTDFRFDSPTATWRLAAQPAQIDYTGDRILVRNVRLDGPAGQRIVATGALGADADAPLEVWVERLALADLDTLVFGGRNVGGRLDAYAAVTGSLDSPSIDARFAVDDGSVRNFQYQSLRGALQTSGDDYAFTVWLLQDPVSWLTAEGSIPRDLFADNEPERPGAGMKVTVQSSPIGLGFIAGLTDTVADVNGTVQADVRVTGTLKQPSFDGGLTIRDGAFRLPALGTSFRGLTTQIGFEPDGMVIPGLRVLDENGESLQFSGRLPYTAGRAGELTVDVDSENFEIVDNEFADIQVSTDLAITGTLLQPHVKGTVRIDDGEIRVDRILDLRQASYYRAAPLEPADVGEQRPTNGESQQEQHTGLLSGIPIGVDITLEMPSLLITGRDLRGPSSVPVGLGDINVTVDGELQLRKPLDGALALRGEVSTVRGTYEFQSRRFDILRGGTIQFPGLLEINPLLDVIAQRTISGVDAQVQIEGTLREPMLTLSSTPPLDQADILSLIVFNQPANELGASQQLSLSRRATALATGFLASRIGESIGSALNLDLLEIETGTTDQQKLAPAVTLGERLGENLFVRVRQQFGPASASQVVLEYRFTDWLRLESSVSEQPTDTQSLFRRGERSGINWIASFSY